MAPRKKKKSKGKQTKSKMAAKRVKKASQGKRAGKMSRPKKAVKKKQSRKKTSLRTSGAANQGALRNDTRPSKSARRRQKPVSGRQSGDLQGLSRSEQADSESIEELVGEGNPSEAGIVAGVEDADNADEREVHTHEVPEDDVPEEYLDKE